MAQAKHPVRAERTKLEPMAGKVAPEKPVLDRAIEVIGDKTEAMRWMGTPVRALGYATPISLLTNRRGCKAVMAVLERLEYGVF